MVLYDSIEAREFLVSCEINDAVSMIVLLEGCRAHSDIAVVQLWPERDTESLKYFRNRYGHIPKMEESWAVLFLNRESLERFTEILATIEFNAADYVRFVELESAPGVDLIFNLPDFHRHVFHES